MAKHDFRCSGWPSGSWYRLFTSRTGWATELVDSCCQLLKLSMVPITAEDFWKFVICNFEVTKGWLSVYLYIGNWKWASASRAFTFLNGSDLFFFRLYSVLRLLSGFFFMEFAYGVWRSTQDLHCLFKFFSKWINLNVFDLPMSTADTILFYCSKKWKILVAKILILQLISDTSDIYFWEEGCNARSVGLYGIILWKHRILNWIA